MHLKTSLYFALIAGLACTANDRAKESTATDSSRADSIARARQDSINRTLPGYVVDSILPVEEELRRFRAAVGGTPASELAGGANSRDALVTRFAKALASGDTTSLQTMELSAREFADLVYPESPYTRPPYHQPPGLVWSQIQNASASGKTRLMRRLFGSPIQIQGHVCDAKPERQGENTISSHCTVRVTEADGSTRDRQLFGAIIERHGRFKFLSYANEF